MHDRGDFAWLDDLLGWCHTLRIVFTRGRSWQEMIEDFGLDPATAVEETLNAQSTHPDQPTIRAGEHRGWGYAVQTTLDLTDNEEQLERHSLPGEAFELSYTMTISLFRYASAGSFVSGFDMTLPQGRWGDPRRFEAEMAEAGFLVGTPNPRTMGPRFVQLAFGVTIPPAMQGPLPSVARPPRPSEPLPPAPPPAPPTSWPGIR